MGIRTQFLDDEIKKRFWNYVRKDHDCWIWIRSCTDDGYGAFAFMGKIWRAHRLAWEFEIGPIPQDLHVLHRCDRRPCVRPSHLFLGNNAINLADKISKGRQARGIFNGTSKLNESLVIEAKKLVMEGVSKREIARRFGVCDRTIRHALCGDTWSSPPLRGTEIVP